MTPDDMEAVVSEWLALAGEAWPYCVPVCEGESDAIRALLLDYRERGREIEKLHAAISWLDQPFIDESTSESELRTRIALMLADVARATLKGKSHD